MICKIIAIAFAFALFPIQEKPGPQTNQEPAELADDQGAVHLQIDMLDGSRIVGIVSPTVVALDLGFDQIDLPLRLVRKIARKPGQDKHTLDLRNRDRFSATLLTERIGMKTRYGDLAVSTDGIKTIRVLGAKNGSGRPDADGLIAYYGFSNDAEDIALNEESDRFHLKLGKTAFEFDGVRGNVLKFDGTEHVRIPHDDAFNSKKLTIAVWVKPNGATGQYSMILGKTNGSGSWIGGYGLVQMANDTENVHFYVNSYSSSVVKCKLAQGKWSQLCGVCDGPTVKIFLNGIQVGSKPLANGAINHGKTPFTIGRDERNGSGRYPWKGSVDDLAIYDRALSAEEIKSLYEETMRDK